MKRLFSTIEASFLLGFKSMYLVNPYLKQPVGRAISPDRIFQWQQRYPVIEVVTPAEKHWGFRFTNKS